MTLELDDDLLAELHAEAARRGVSIEAVATEWLLDNRSDAGDIDDELAAKGFGRDE